MKHLMLGVILLSLVACAVTPPPTFLKSKITLDHSGPTRTSFGVAGSVLHTNMSAYQPKEYYRGQKDSVKNLCQQNYDQDMACDFENINPNSLSLAYYIGGADTNFVTKGVFGLFTSNNVIPTGMFTQFQFDPIFISAYYGYPKYGANVGISVFNDILSASLGVDHFADSLMSQNEPGGLGMSFGGTPKFTWENSLTFYASLSIPKMLNSKTYFDLNLFAEKFIAEKKNYIGFGFNFSTAFAVGSKPNKN